MLLTQQQQQYRTAQHHSGQMAVLFSAYDIQHVQHFAPWLEKHGHLLKSLQLNLNLTGKEWLEAESLIASALQRAKGASSQGLQMQTYRSYPACGGSVLQWLPTYYMRQLELGPRAEYSRWARQLTQLAIHDITTSTAAAKLKWIPAQLQLLQMSLSRIRKCEALPPLKLGHLTKLTELSSSSKPLVLQQGDELPASLVVLRVRDCRASEPLLSLTRLQVLEMSLSTTPADVLLALASGLPQLQEVSLCYGEMADAAAAAAGWSALPLRSLDFRAVEGCVSAATLQQLATLQDLVRLDVYGGTGCCRYAGKFEATPQQLAAVLGQMTGLQELGLRGFELLPEPEPEPQPEVHNALNGLSLEDQSESASLTGEVLPASIAKELSQLSELCVLRTGIRKHAEGFKARLLSLNPRLMVKSSARG
ncbi:hypothetical protein COO60DRAFT_1627961 [Scenedesmus sp. NREL 46B-D3]|nr:hypothetical protein COO60DRAFT_1627961 [Scenedesmus sp. NREL 46B-D3]